MDSCRTMCRILMVLIGLASFALATFMCYDLGVNYAICSLHTSIIGRLSIACLTLYLSSWCGLLPKPKIPILGRCPIPWKLWKRGYGCLKGCTLQSVSVEGAYPPGTSTSQTSSIPRMRHKREFSKKKYAEKKEFRRVRFILPENSNDRMNRNANINLTRRRNMRFYKMRADYNIRLKKKQLEIIRFKRILKSVKRNDVSHLPASDLPKRSNTI